MVSISCVCVCVCVRVCVCLCGVYVSVCVCAHNACTSGHSCITLCIILPMASNLTWGASVAIDLGTSSVMDYRTESLKCFVHLLHCMTLRSE